MEAAGWRVWTKWLEATRARAVKDDLADVDASCGSGDLTVGHGEEHPAAARYGRAAPTQAHLDVSLTEQQGQGPAEPARADDCDVHDASVT